MKVMSMIVTETMLVMEKLYRWSDRICSSYYNIVGLKQFSNIQWTIQISRYYMLKWCTFTPHYQIYHQIQLQNRIWIFIQIEKNYMNGVTLASKVAYAKEILLKICFMDECKICWTKVVESGVCKGFCKSPNVEIWLNLSL